MAYRIPPLTPELARLERQAIEDLTELFPDKVVTGLDSKDEALGRRIEELCARMGYVSRRSMLEAWGFEYQRNPGGRPATVDAEAILGELEHRYADKPKPATITQLREENPDLAGALKSLSSMSRKLFGQSLGKELEARGLVVKQPKTAGRAAEKKDEPSIMEDDVKRVLHDLEDRVRSTPIGQRPTNITGLYEAYPEYVGVIRTARKLKLTSVRELRDLGILQSAEQQKRELKTLNIWKADVGTLAKVYEACGGAELILPEDGTNYSKYLRNGVIGLDVKNGWELRETTLVTTHASAVAVGEEYNLIVKDKPSHTLYGGYKGNAWVNDFELGVSGGDTVPRDRQLNFLRRPYDMFITMDATNSPEPSTPLDVYAQPSAKVISSENVGGRQVFRLQYRFLVPLSRETLLAALWKMGAVTTDDLQGGLEWREWLSA